MHLIQALTPILVIFLTNTVTTASVQCTPGRRLTKEEYAEYETLNSTKEWPAMDSVTHCRMTSEHQPDTTSESSSKFLEARTPYDHNYHPKVRSLNPRKSSVSVQPYDLITYASEGCKDSYLSVLFKWGCEVCFTFATDTQGTRVWSALLWNGFISNDDFPGARYYTEQDCQGDLIYAQNLRAKQDECVNLTTGAASALLWHSTCSWN